MTDCYLDFFCIMSVDDGSGSRFEQQKQQPDKSYMHVDFAPATGVSGKSWVWTLGWGQKDATGRKYWEICDKIQKETLGDSSSALLMPVELLEQFDRHYEKLKTDVEEVKKLRKADEAESKEKIRELEAQLERAQEVGDEEEALRQKVQLQELEIQKLREEIHQLEVPAPETRSCAKIHQSFWPDRRAEMLELAEYWRRYDMENYRIAPTQHAIAAWSHHLSQKLFVDAAAEGGLGNYAEELETRCTMYGTDSRPGLNDAKLEIICQRSRGAKQHWTCIHCKCCGETAFWQYGEQYEKEQNIHARTVAEMVYFFDFPLQRKCSLHPECKEPKLALCPRFFAKQMMAAKEKFTSTSSSSSVAAGTNDSEAKKEVGFAAAKYHLRYQ